MYFFGVNETKISMIVGQRITHYRKTRGLQQKVLAEMVGVTPTALNYYEKGKSEPNILTLRKLADAFCITLDELVDFYPSGNKIKTAESELLSAYRRLNSAGQSEAVKRVSELSELSRYVN